MFEVSACLWSLSSAPLVSVARARQAGFDLVDLRPDCWEGLRDAGHLASLGVAVSCCGITPVKMAPGISLNSLATDEAPAAIEALAGAIARASSLGARCAYMVTPDARAGASSRYIASVAELARSAASQGMKLCVEPHPGRALSNYAEVMRFLDAAKEPNLYALLDLGHIRLGGEELARTVAMLGERIGYVHVDDNDGKADRHFGLMEGVLKPRDLYEFLDALAASPYRGPLAFEINKGLPAPLSSMVSSRDFTVRWAERRFALAGR